MPASLKNAIDYLYREWNKKPAAFVSYGNAGGARAVEQLRMILVEVQMPPLRNAVHIIRGEFLELAQGKKTFSDFPHRAQAATLMLDELVWWTRTLRAGRMTEYSRHTLGRRSKTRKHPESFAELRVLSRGADGTRTRPRRHA